MSLHHQFIFPRYPHQPAPDWQYLESRLLEDGYVLDPRGADVPQRALINLSMGVSQALGCDYQYSDAMRTTADVLALYANIGKLPTALADQQNLSVLETHALLARHGITCDPLWDDAESSDHCSPLYRLGPTALMLLRDLMGPYIDDERSGCHVNLRLLTYDGPHPHVPVGENLSPPCLPGSDETLDEMAPFGDHLDLIGVAYENPSVQWRCAENQQNYYLFDLDWQGSLALGYRLIRTEGLAPECTERLATLVSSIVGQEMAYSHRHL